MKILSWNMRSAGPTREAAWDYFREIDPDLALLQDVTSLPDDLHASYDLVDSVAVKRDGTDQRFKTMILVKGQIGPQIPIEFPLDWMNEEFQRMGRNLICRTVQTELGLDLKSRIRDPGGGSGGHGGGSYVGEGAYKVFGGSGRLLFMILYKRRQMWW